MTEHIESGGMMSDNTNQAKVIAYVRVSDSAKQDSSAQRKTISEYVEAEGLNVDQWREFHLSGSKTTKSERGLYDLMRDLEEGDHVVVADVSRIGRDSTADVVNVITSLITSGVTLHFAYNSSSLAPEDRDDIGKIFMVVGEAWAAVKFAQERSIKAKTACKVRKEKGLHNGRKVGARVKSKFDEHRLFIMDELDKGTSKAEILRLLNKRGVDGGKTAFFTWINTRLNGKSISIK